MAYILLHKPYIVGDDFVPWKPLEFGESYELCVGSLVRKKFKFKRGDLFTIVSAEYASDIDEHYLAAFIAMTNKNITPVSAEWLSRYRYSIQDALDLEGSSKSISSAYIMAMAYEALKTTYIEDRPNLFFNKYGILIERWIRVGNPDEIKSSWEAASIDPVLALENSFIDDLVFRCLRAITGDSLYEAHSIFDEVEFFHDDQAALMNIVRSMLPLPQLILAILEKRMIKLSWE